MKKYYILISGILTLFALNSCNQSNTKNKEGENVKKQVVIDKNDMNLNIKPGDDFYNYSNGGWIKSHPVPADKTQYGSFTVLYDENQEKLKSLINEIAKAKNEQGTNAQKIADLYNSGMDTVKIEELGNTPLKEYLNNIDKISNKEDLVKEVAFLHTHAIFPLFFISDVQDEKNSVKEIAVLFQGGLGLPDRDYYLSKDDRSEKIRKEYKSYISKLFSLSDFSQEDADKNAKTVFDIETKLANNSFTRLELRNPFNNYNKVDLEGLEKISPNFDWDLYFKSIKLDSTNEINVAQKKFIAGLSDLINKIPIDNWKVYLKWNLINNSANYLSKDFVTAHFDFYGKTLSGQQKMQDRWKVVLSTVNGAMGEALGELYVKKYFPPEAKTRMQKLIANLRSSFKNRIKKLDWMTDTTKQKAIEKLDAITVKVGYPDKWKDYSKLEITNDSYYNNVMNARKFAFAESINRIGKPYDKTRWGMTPQTVNAYYSPNSNEIVFPAAILQPPFFYMNADDAVNYGAIGVVIGHEMTHGFDDQGRNYDKYGNLNNWWTEEDSKAFDEKKQVVINQFNNYVVLDSLHVNGELTIGENIADLGGLNISWDAFQSTPEAKDTSKIEGFTPAQRFILSYSKVWRQSILPEELMRRLKEDVHSPGEARVNVPLFNLDFMYENFPIKETDKLYRKPADRAKIW